MLTFLEETLEHIQKTHQNLSDAVFILPSKRAGGFLKNYLRKTATSTQFLPKISSIEDLIQELSGLQIIDTTELLFKSYEVYKKTSSFKEKESFDQYAGWATTLLNDFNEVDRHLVDTQQFFDYLGSIKALERWNVTSQKTHFLENYVTFWKSLPLFYENLKAYLIENGVAYQGLVYREAVVAIEHYLHVNAQQQHYFIGFNALNVAEQQIIQAFLENGNSEVYWDAERSFVEDAAHSASLFFRRYTKQWKYFQQNNPQFISENFSGRKHINFVACQKNVSQLKYVGELLAKFSEEKLKNTAIVLADETLLLPLLHSLPQNVIHVNVTMGASLKTFPVTVFFESLLAVQSKNNSTYYYKDILKIIGHPVASKLIVSKKIIAAISEENRSHYSLAQLLDIVEQQDKEIVTTLFNSFDDSPKKALVACEFLLQKLKGVIEKRSLENVVLFELHGIFTNLQSLEAKFDHLASLGALQELFLELIATTTIDFKGDAYEGLQVMGVLETRVLDFENVVLLSVNEGILPAGKSNSSYITYDLKKQFNLPLFTEKDAIYTYHFYHMLHRAKEVTMCYTNTSEGLNSGEKSRFLLQLEIEKQAQHVHSKFQVSPSLTFSSESLKTISKTESVQKRLQAIAAKGFSPSALTSYIRNPIDFYYQKVLGIKELDEVEETVAYNTLGTVVHDTLQHLYEPYCGTELSLEILKKLKSLASTEVAKQFSKSFSGGDISKGKNLIIFEVAKRYVHNLISLDESDLQSGNTIKIEHIESNLRVQLPISELSFPVHIHGKVDRVDSFNGQLRIIDYKTGSVHQGDLELVDWSTLNQDYKFSKAFQVLTYALMLHENHGFTSTQGGIISFKNMQGGFLKFCTKDSSRTKNYNITEDTLLLFKEELKNLILEICNLDTPFTEKEID
ncbi:PD-(D/E)XK nuclease family protein [Rasiella rasia]|uniref:PD-(D/E)XK nuclease family protein n=1 Tax=Rasiella rasia TaxID=2744027 RepID=A0A6G6GMS3_9FLAO|nr:PD-(D/E)XK nuclease family protein [Rasiella rasia]QIE59824.1 PD-(D/E)XK nuclease family protein [Rasiella rasia]